MVHSGAERASHTAGPIMKVPVAVICVALFSVLTTGAHAQRQLQKVTGPTATAFTANAYGARSAHYGDWAIVTALGASSGAAVNSSRSAAHSASIDSAFSSPTLKA